MPKGANPFKIPIKPILMGFYLGGLYQYRTLLPYVYGKDKEAGRAISG